MFAALLLSLACTLPAHIHITAPDPCWTAARMEKEWPELEARVRMTRQVLDLPYQPVALEAAQFDIVEHGDEFTLKDGFGVLGVFSPHGKPNRIDGKTSDRDRIDYSRVDDFDYRVVLHEMGHYRYRLEMARYGEGGSAGGYFAHGNRMDPVIQALNRLIGWFWPGKHDHPYFPGLLGESEDGEACVVVKGGAK